MPTREEQELETLKANSPYALPDDAAASGWTTAQKKEKFYAGLLYLYELFKASRSSTEGTVSEFTEKVNACITLVDAFIEADKASKDGDNNVISATYAKIANIANGTIPAVKYKKGENETENINAIEPRLMILINKILGYFTGGKANNALSADKATSDGDGRSIKTTYATKTETATIQTAINNILNGASTVAKSLGDGNGNTISSTYETKSDATAKVARTNLVSIIGEATTSLSGLLSATDKSRLNALYALLGASDDGDTVVNTINEVLAIFSQYPEGVTLTNALALKVAISDIVDNLTTQDATKPLSAKQGYVLKGLINALTPVDNLTSTSTTAPLTAKQGKVLKDLIDDLERWYLALSGIAEDYDSTSTYSKGDVVANSGNLFRAKADITTPEQWTAAHWESVTVVELINEKLTRGDYDSTTGAGYADQASNLIATRGTEVEHEFAELTQFGASVTDGSFANIRGIKGNSVAWSQLIKNAEFASTSYWRTNNGSLSVSNGVGTFTYSGSGSNGWAQNLISANVPLIAGHKYLLTFNLLERSLTDPLGVQLRINNYPNHGSTYSNAQTVGIHNIILSPNYTVSDNGIQFGVFNAYQNGDYFKIRDVYLIDITNTDITSADDPRVQWLIAHAKKNQRYDAGSILDSKPTKLYSRKAGFNSVPLNKIGAVDLSTLTWEDRGGGTFRATIPTPANHVSNYQAVNAISSKYSVVAQANVTSNDKQLAFNTSTQIYIQDSSATASTITGILYYEKATAGSTVEQAVLDRFVLGEYPLNLPILRSAASVQDTDKKVNVGRHTFTGTESWAWDENLNTWYFTSSNFGAKDYGESICSNGIKLEIAVIADGSGLVFRCIQSNNPSITSSTNMNELFSSSVSMNYELATPTDQENVSLPERVKVAEGGSLEVVYDSDYPVPCDLTMFYQVNLREKVETLPDAKIADGVYVTEVSSGNAEFTPLADWLDDNGYKKASELPTKEALGGTLRQLLAVKENIDISNTDYIDLGDRTWYYSGGQFYSPGLPSGFNSQVTPIASNCFKTGVVADQSFWFGSDINAKDARYTDGNAFKESVKGVLLAYGKASS